MARKVSDVAIDFAFYRTLWQFYRANRKKLRSTYKDLTKKYLDFNEDAFLRAPQYEALEMYVFLKEGLGNPAVSEIFKQWWEKEGVFAARADISLFEDVNRAQYETVFKHMQRFKRAYPNYIFALTMGTGKTILMAACIFYEFLLANKYPQDPRYCHNAVVFAPDKTVLQALREIQSFDLSKVVPPEYVNFLVAHLKFHYLDEAGTALSALDGSRFNLIVSNTQKIILKRQHKEKTAAAKLFDVNKPVVTAGSVYDAAQDLYGFDEPDDEDSLTTNQRYTKLTHLGQLGIYVDEAHHAFGTKLAEDMGAKENATSLRRTIDELALSLERSGTHVVACYNFTGTPYVGKAILPEVVYAYGLQEAIDKKFLKKALVHGYTQPKTEEFVREAIKTFLAATKDQRYEGMLPKLAFFASTIEELNQELRPAVESALADHGIPVGSVLVNVGDEKLTSNDDIREFNRLDTPDSTKQFILLVNKGREGWNCRSLFGVALYRRPKSKIFVLQAAMRCLRAITDVQQVGQVFLSDENKTILEEELEQNFRVSIDDISAKPDDKQDYEVRVVKPIPNITIKRVSKRYELVDRPVPPGYSLELDKPDLDKYRLIHTTQEGLNLAHANRARLAKEDLTAYRIRSQYSRITLVAEIARYLNRSPIDIETILGNTAEGIDAVVDAVNEFNELLYDWIIPRLFEAMYKLKEFEYKEEFDIDLIKEPPKGYYEVRANPDLVASRSRTVDEEGGLVAKSFHLDHYCFDSNPERDAFWQLLRDKRVTSLYFTGMLTHGQSDFFVQYIDPDSHTIRTYYPDFIIQEADGSYTILEIKADFQIDAAVVQAKKLFAEQMAVASGMRYAILKSSEATAGRSTSVLAN
jgi:superfamily II DNA or RNA helicase